MERTYEKKLFWSFTTAATVLAALLFYLYFAQPKIWQAGHFYITHRELWGKGHYYIQTYRLGKQVFLMERQGKKNRAAHQILTEIRWLLGNTRDYKRISERIQALRSALNDPALYGADDEQSPEDGSWGKWYTEWFWKLDASCDQIFALAEEGKMPKYPVRFLDRINSPEKLKAHLNHLLISEPEHDGSIHRAEYNETLSALIRLIVRQQPRNYPFHPQITEALMDFLMNRARDPETGYWGAWYQSGDQIKKTADMSITFHVVRFLKGHVPDWPKIIDTTLAVKDKEWPLGWLESGAYLNHNNMGVIDIFRLGWPHATPAQQASMRVEIRKMLDWCLKNSLQPDGSFRMTMHDDSLETCVYFGTSFLGRIGYFDPKRRFWTQEEFPEAVEARQHITRFIREHFDSGGEGGTYYRNALEELGESKP